jgi:hypothetical protein
LAITEHQSIWRTAPKAGDSATPVASNVRHGDVDDPPLAYEPRWERWKVTLVVVLFCAAFWSGVGYIATRLLG